MFLVEEIIKLKKKSKNLKSYNDIVVF